MIVGLITNSAFIIVIAIVAIIGTDLAHEGCLVLFVPRLTNSLASAGNAQEVARNAGRTYICVKTHTALRETICTDDRKVIKIARKGETSLRVRKQSPVVKRLTTG